MAKTLIEHNPEPAIRRLLRNQDTLQYFKDDGWTGNPAEAKSFSDVVEAAELCARLHLEHVEMALRSHPNDPDLFCTTIR